MKLPSLRSKVILATATLVLALTGNVFCQSDDFNDGNDNGWTRYQPLAPFGAPGTYSFPSGGYRIQAAASPNPGALGPGRAGSILDGTNYAAFMVSVDLVAWDNNLVQTFGLVARIAQPGLGTSDGYYLHYNPQNTPGVGAFTLDRIDNESPFELNGVDITLNPALDYRMVLTGIGSMFTAQIFALSDLITPLASFSATDSTYASGAVGLLTAGQVPQGATSTTDATFDNFSAAVPEPSTVLLLVAGGGMLAFVRRRLRAG